MWYFSVMIRHLFRASRQPLMSWTLVAMMACSAGESTPKAAESAAASTTLQTTGDAPLEGTWQDGDERIEWRASTHDGVISAITERYTFGTDGRGERTLRFDGNAALMQADESSTQTMQFSDRSPAPSTVKLSLAIEADSTVAATKVVDGVATAVRDYEIARLRRHARSLVEYILSR